MYMGSEREGVGLPYRTVSIVAGEGGNIEGGIGSVVLSMLLCWPGATRGMTTGMTKNEAGAGSKGTKCTARGVETHVLA